MWRLTKAMTEMKCEHWTKRWDWSSCTKLALSASWTHGMVAQSIRVSERNSVVVGSNPTQSNFLWLLQKSFSAEYHIYIYIYLYIYIYIYIYRYIYIYIWYSALKDFWSSHRKLDWVGFEPTTTELRSDTLMDWATMPWVQLALRANFVQLLQSHLFVQCSHFISVIAFVSRHICFKQNLAQVTTLVAE